MSNRFDLAHVAVAVLFAMGSGVAGAFELKLNGSAPDNIGASLSGADFPAPGSGEGALTADSGPMVIASDAAWADSPSLSVTGTKERRSQDFSFLIDAVGTETQPEQFTMGMSYYMDIALTNAMFGVDLGGGISAHAGTGLSPVSGLTIVDPAPTGTGTGKPTESTVRLQLVASQDVGDIYLTLPVELSNAICTSINDASLSVTLSSVTTVPAVPPATDATETTVTQIGSVLTKTFLECGKAFSLTLAADTEAGGGSSTLKVPEFNEFVAGTAGPTVDLNGDAMGNGVPEGTSLADTAKRAAVGFYQITFAPDSAAPDKKDLSFVYDLSDWADRAFTGSVNSFFVSGSNLLFSLRTISDGNLASASIGIANSAPTTNFIAASSGTGTVAEVRAEVGAEVGETGLNTSNFSQPIFVEINESTARSAETIYASGIINFSGTSLQSVFANGRLSFGAETQLDSIGFEAGYCGEFDWVNSRNDRFDMIRITGHGPDVTEVVATLSNVNVPAGGTAPEPATWEKSSFGDISNGDANLELVVTTFDLRNKFGDFGTGDLQLMVMGAGADLDCDRLISAGSTGFVTPYGNDGGVADSDGDD